MTAVRVALWCVIARCGSGCLVSALCNQKHEERQTAIVHTAHRTTRDSYHGSGGGNRRRNAQASGAPRSDPPEREWLAERRLPLALPSQADLCAGSGTSVSSSLKAVTTGVTDRAVLAAGCATAGALTRKDLPKATRHSWDARVPARMRRRRNRSHNRAWSRLSSIAVFPPTTPLTMNSVQRRMQQLLFLLQRMTCCEAIQSPWGL